MLAAWRYAYLQPVLLHAACLCSVAALLLAALLCSACSLLLLIAACVRRDAVVGTRRRPLLPVVLAATWDISITVRCSTSPCAICDTCGGLGAADAMANVFFLAPP